MACHPKPWRRMAEGGGFEPPLRYKRKHAFQACALSHSATLPQKFGGAWAPVELRRTIAMKLCRSSVVEWKLPICHTKWVSR